MVYTANRQLRNLISRIYHDAFAALLERIAASKVELTAARTHSKEMEVGQAKLRAANREERIALAQARQLNEEPINVVCKTCGEVLNGFELLQNSSAGAAWQKTCSCGAVTTAVVQSRHSTLQRAFASTLGLAKEIAGKDQKVSVSFIEKNLDTVETGLIRLG